MNTMTRAFLTMFLLLLPLPLSADDKSIESSKAKLAKHKHVSERMVIVSGAVQRLGPVEYEVGATVYAMILKAGGPTKYGTLKRVTVMRDGKSLRLDLTNEETKTKMLAKPNDTIDVSSTFLPDQ